MKNVALSYLEERTLCCISMVKPGVGVTCCVDVRETGTSGTTNSLKGRTLKGILY